jgi:hypothetical protein
MDGYYVVHTPILAPISSPPDDYQTYTRPPINRIQDKWAWRTVNIFSSLEDTGVEWTFSISIKVWLIPYEFQPERDSNIEP